MGLEENHYMKKAIMMDPRDNVATALTALEPGDEIEVISAKRETVQQVQSRDSLPLGHKIALTDLRQGDTVVKYGAKIGRASKDIAVGDYVHVHNVVSDRMPLTENMLGHK